MKLERSVTDPRTCSFGELCSLLRFEVEQSIKDDSDALPLQGRLCLYVKLCSLALSPQTGSLTSLNPAADMVPPFLAYHGLVYADKDVLLAGYTQCKLYRDGLQDDSTKLWRHIEGVSTDGGLWGTGESVRQTGLFC